MKFLKPQRLKPAYYQGIQKALERLFYDLVYRPVVTTIKAETGHVERLNADVAALERAVAEGKVGYTQDNAGKGIFSGKFNAAIARQIRALGGTFDSRSGVYHIDQALVPAGIKASAAQAQLKAQDLHTSILKELDAAQGGLPDKIEQMDLPIEGAITGINRDLNSIIVTPELTDDAKIRMAEDYNKNMKLYIKTWAEQKIEDLRRDVTANARAGYRFDNLVGIIRDDYGTTQRKAEFLARQETGLFMAKFRRERLGDVGVRQYKWSARSSKLTRPDHWALNGKIFSYDSPPIVDRATGRKGNPGEDFGCLCADIPILGRADVQYQGAA